MKVIGCYIEMMRIVFKVYFVKLPNTQWMWVIGQNMQIKFTYKRHKFY